jgi:hypothetical protein
LTTTNANFKVKKGLDAGGDITTTGIFKSTSSSGDDGGQIDLTKSETNTTLTTGVSIDVFQNKLRFFETGGTNRGYYIDISGGGASVGTNLVGGSGFTGAGTSITNITGAASNSMTITSAASGNGNLSLVSAGTGTVSIDTAGAATASIANINATTVNVAGSAGTVNIANAAVSSKTLNIGTDATAGGSTTINIGTSSATASTVIKIGNATLSTSSDIMLQGAVYVGKTTSASSTGTVTGYDSSINILTTTNTSTNTSSNVTGGNLSIYSGGAILNANSGGNATAGNLNLDTGSATTSNGTAFGGTINIGKGYAATIVLGSTSTSYTSQPTTITINGTVSGHTLSGTLVGPASTVSISALRLPSGVVPSSANQQFGMIAADAESLQLATTKTTGAGPGFGYIRAPQIVYTVANTNTVTTNTAASVFDAANDVLSSLEVAKAYRFRGTYYVTSTFTSGTAAIQLLFAFANSPVAFKYNFKTYKSSGTAMDQVGLITTNAASSVSAGVTATATYVIEFEGFFTSNATTGGTFTPKIQMSGTGSSTVVNAASWFEVEKLGSSTQTLIAGNWG